MTRGDTPTWRVSERTGMAENDATPGEWRVGGLTHIDNSVATLWSITAPCPDLGGRYAPIGYTSRRADALAIVAAHNASLLECANPECDHDRTIPSPGCSQRRVIPPADSWARKHARENPGHRTREGLDDPGSCDDCRDRSPAYGLADARVLPPEVTEADRG